MKKFAVIVLVVLGIIVAFAVAVSLYLPVSDPLEKADAIVVVSGGDTAGRTRHAISLYQAGWAPILVFSGAAADPNSASNARAMMAIAVSKGIARDKIILDEKARDTKENAANTEKLIGGYKTVILVTSDYHQRRASREFVKAYGSDVKIINAPAKDKNWGRKSWFLTPYGWWISVTESTSAVINQIKG